MNNRIIFTSFMIIGLLALAVWGIMALVDDRQPEPVNNRPSVKNVAPTPTATAKTKTLSTSDIVNHHGVYAFSSLVPNNWEAEAVSTIDSINIFDPQSEETNNLDKSRIFIRYFKANDFQTLASVDIQKRTLLTINKRPAVRYEIQKKTTVSDFPNQPAWRNAYHVVTDIRVNDTNPAVFYVIAKRPELDEAIYQEFLESLILNQ